MEIKNPTPMYKVNIVEYERGWGSKVDEIKYFDNEVEAKQFCKEFNARNTELIAPDWYMIADYQGKVC